MDASERGWEIEILYTLVGKTNFDIILHFRAHSKHLLLLLTLQLKEKISSDDTCFEGAICKDCRLTLCKTYKRLRKCYVYYVYYVFRNV